jgi:hypothetical protein
MQAYFAHDVAPVHLDCAGGNLQISRNFFGGKTIGNQA